MPGNTEKARERRQAVLSAVICGAGLLALAAVFLWLRRFFGLEGWLSGLFVILAVLSLAQLAALAKALWERLREIEKGALYDSVDD